MLNQAALQVQMSLQVAPLSGPHCPNTAGPWLKHRQHYKKKKKNAKPNRNVVDFQKSDRNTHT